MSVPSRRALAVLLAVAAAATTYVIPGRPADAVAADVPDTTWVANGNVESVLSVGNRTYLGGSFDQIGPNTGFGVPLEGASVAATFPKVNGPIYAAVPDGDNGWYIGGDFTRVGSKSRHNVAQVLDDGTVSGWNPNADRPVRAIVVDNPNKRIYLGGEFTQLRSNTQLPDGTYEMVAAGGLAATKKSGGAIDTTVPLPAMAPNPSTEPGALRYSVNALALSGDKSTLYVGGLFTTLGGIARPNLAKVNLGGAPAVDAAWNPQPNGPVAALLSAGGNRVMVGGSFTAIGATARTGLAVVSETGTGSVDPVWDLAANGPVYALAGGTSAPGAAGIWIGGAFTELRGQARNRLALIGTQAANGYLDGFNPNGVGADGDVYSLAMHPTSPTLYVGGAFKSLGGASHRHFAVVNTEFGIVSPAEPMIAGPVRAVAASATQVYAGGDFTAVGGEIRRNVAALLPDGSLDTAFRADTDGPVYALAADASSLYVGGMYKNIAQYTQREHRGLTKVSLATGAVDDAFKANIDASVYALAVSGPRLFVGGNFSAVSNRTAGGSVDIPRAGGASVNTTTGAVEAWNPSPDAAIHHLVLSPDHSRVYIGGDFKKVGITPKTRMAAVDTASGAPTLWTPAVPGQVIKMIPSADGSKIFVAVGGSYATGNRLQAWSTVNSSLLWEALGDGDFQAVALSSSLLYAGGHFDVINKTAVRQHLAAFDPNTGALQPWGPPIGGIKGVLDLQVTGSHVWVAGEFDKIGGVVAQGIARFTNDGDPPPTTTSTAPGTVPTTVPATQPPAGGSPGGGTPGGGDPGPGAGAAGAKAGYWMVGSEGAVFSFGDAGHHGGALPAPGTSVVDLEPTPSGKGYWLVTDKGVVTTHGDAVSFGAPVAGSIPRGETVTSLSATPSGRGYWLFTSKGRVLSFGDATHFGDMAAIRLNAPVLDSIPTTTGQGYYMVAADGGIFSFGDAKFYGSMGGQKLNAPVQSLVPDGDGVGYWLVASDGGIFAFQAGFKGSMGGKPLNKPVTGMVRFADGYLMVGEDGGIFNFSSKQFLGSLGANPPARPIVSVAALG